MQSQYLFILNLLNINKKQFLFGCSTNVYFVDNYALRRVECGLVSSPSLHISKKKGNAEHVQIEYQRAGRMGK